MLRKEIRRTVMKCSRFKTRKKQRQTLQAAFFVQQWGSNWQWFVYNVRRLEGNWAKQVIFCVKVQKTEIIFSSNYNKTRCLDGEEKNLEWNVLHVWTQFTAWLHRMLVSFLFPRFYGPIHFRISQFTSISCIAKVMMNSCEKGHQKNCWQNSCQFGLKSHNKKVSQEWRKH